MPGTFFTSTNPESAQPGVFANRVTPLHIPLVDQPHSDAEEPQTDATLALERRLGVSGELEAEQMGSKQDLQRGQHSCVEAAGCESGLPVAWIIVDEAIS